MDISETLAQEIKKHDNVYSFMKSVSQQRKKGNIKINPDKEGVGKYRELVTAFIKRKKRGKDMNKEVVEYFDTYFSNFDGELNESTSNEQLEEAALDLINLTEEVLLFVESAVFKKAAQLAQAKKLKQGLQRSRFPITRGQREKNVARKVLAQTPAGRQTLRQVDDPELIKRKEQSLRRAIEKDPAATRPHKVKTGHDIETREPIYHTQKSQRVATDVKTKEPVMRTTTKTYTPVRSELEKGTEYGSKKAKEIAQAQHKSGQAVHSAKRKVFGKSPDATHSGLIPGKSYAPKKDKRTLGKLGSGKLGKAAKTAAKVAGIGALGALGLGAGGLGIAAMQKESVNNGKKEKEEEHPPSMPVGELEHVRNLKLRKQRLDTMRKERDIKDKRTDVAAETSAGESPHKQKSLVIHDPEKGGWTPITDKGAKEVERETKSAAEKSSSIMDIIKKHPQLKHREKMGGTRKEREARGQGRLDFDPPTKPDEPTKKVPSHLKLGDGKGSPSDRFRTSIPLNRSSTDRRTRTRKGSEATK